MITFPNNSSGLEQKQDKVSAKPIAFFVLFPLILYLSLIFFPQFDLSHKHIHGHFYIVSLAAVWASIIAISVGWVGTRLRNIQVQLVSLAFISLAMIFSMHGLATPGFILPANSIIKIAANLSLFTTSFWLLLSSFPGDASLIKQLHKLNPYLIPGWVGLLLTFGGVLFMFPQIADALPVSSDPLKYILAWIGMSLCLATARRYWNSYLFTRAPLQLAMVYCAGWLTVAQFIMVTGKTWMSSWWIYHLLILFACIMMVYGLAKQYFLGHSLATVLPGLWSANPVDRLESVISPDLRRMITETEAHDSYTAGHNYRVAKLAVQLGQTMGLKPEQLRALAQGGIIHDIGKLNVPVDILNKPGRLDDNERKTIELHPLHGWQLAKFAGFMPEELAVIRHHHERWDGAGYPDGLAAEDIPLLARITSVIDVYDALTSERAYRQPWSHEKASTLIIEQAGSQFCPTVVEAWKELSQALAEEQAEQDVIEHINVFDTITRPALA
ncbi:MAG: HD-GYP domain-containing protein [Trueperaceae bacterium]|nr:HD-GYP domain-containing protein [Trueperaceae bacterium]